MKYKETISFDNGSVVAVNDLVSVVDNHGEIFIGRVDKIELGMNRIPMIKIDMSKEYRSNVAEVRIVDIVNINLVDKENK
ncbi:hypothetical protein [Anaerorhabdus sp.]|uniref:hypothetical protein n=1 Tax=Anaerorhabdus sp. TaxID=1872524 RepID=UPI002FC5AF35